MGQDFQPGDFLIFQVESGYGLLRVLAVDGGADPIWHVSVYRNLFQEVEFADAAAGSPESLTVEIPHIALTNRAFESTQVARLLSAPLDEKDTSAYEQWKSGPNREISDRSIRLTLGLR
jgi:hypothetical protein